MNWVLSEAGGWVEEEIAEEGKRKNSVPRLPDELVLFIYEMSIKMHIQDIMRKGIHPLFDTLSPYRKCVYKCITKHDEMNILNRNQSEYETYMNCYVRKIVVDIDNRGYIYTNYLFSSGDGGKSFGRVRSDYFTMYWQQRKISYYKTLGCVLKKIKK